MKIGIDIRSIGRQRTGDETYTKGLVSALLSIDKVNDYFLYTDTDNKSELKRIREMLGPECLRNNVSIVPVLPSSKLLWTMLFLSRRAKKDQLDLLHVQYISPIFLTKKTALVSTIHDVSFKRYPQYIRLLDLVFLNTLIPLSLKRANAVVAVSKFTRKELLECYRINEQKVHAIVNGYQAELYENEISLESKRSFLAKHKLEEPYIFYLGTLQPRKNVPFLIKGFAHLKKKYNDRQNIKNLKLVIGGSLKGRNVDREIFREIESIKQAQIRDSIRFAGYIGPNDLPYFYQCAQAYVNASLYEGFGLPLIESMGSGTPVVCSQSSCFPEIAGNAASFFQNKDKKDFSRAVYEALEDHSLREDLIQKGKENAKRFSWKKNGEQILELYGIINQGKTQQ